MNKLQIVLLLAATAILATSCNDNNSEAPEDIPREVFDPSPYELVIPNGFPDMYIPSNNKLTVEGINLGRQLFYDSILSGDNTQSCASCHAQAFSFSDNGNQFSKGIDGKEGNRNSPGIINAGWSQGLFWDGRAFSLEEQALGPVPNPIEMHEQWTDAMDELNAHSEYPDLFYNAFGTSQIDSTLVVKAIAQFERILISSNSTWDKYLSGEVSLTRAEVAGMNLFFNEKGDCFHCHGTILFTDNLFHNNGLDTDFIDLGLGMITGNLEDNGKFKTPTLRNIAFTAPYMHDGRFNTLEEVLDFYSADLKESSTIDPLMKIREGGVQLSDIQKQNLIAFLKILSDTTFITNPDYSSPF